MDRLASRWPWGAWGLALLAALLTSGRISSADEPAEIRVARLVRQLGAGGYDDRRKAADELAALGRDSRVHLERALKDPDYEVRLRAEQLLADLAVEELWTPSLVDHHAGDQLASDILRSLAIQTGNRLYLGEPYGTFHDLPLEVSYRKTKYWQALDDICDRTGNRLRPHYDVLLPGFVISSGDSQPTPRAYGGKLRAQITLARRVFVEEKNYEEAKADLTHTFQVNLKVNWEDQFHIVGYAVAPELVEAVTDTGVNVGASNGGSRGWNAAAAGLREVSASLQMQPVPLAARSFDKFKIRWGMIAVAQPAELVMSNLEAKRQFSQDDLLVQIESIERDTPGRCVLTLSIVRDLALPEPLEIVFQEYHPKLFDDRDRAWRLQNETHALTQQGIQLTLTFLGHSEDAEPSRLVLGYPRQRSKRDVELEFRQVPLPLARPE